MVADRAKKPKDHQKTKRRVAEAVNTLEWLITAFVLAFVFRAFVMEAFRIPTGSMADTLNGAHLRLRCVQCGYKYNYGVAEDVQRFKNKSYMTRCPSCGYRQSSATMTSPAGGDRVLVLKCIYQFFEPKRWDVVVFKNPTDPKINFIKRLIGKPGETVEIIDGDIYIDGQIARKPPKTQQELWMSVYDNDYRPVLPGEGNFNGHFWQLPFDFADSKWRLSKDNPTELILDSDPEEINSFDYDTDLGNDFKVNYAYNEIRYYKYSPYCSDLMVRFYANWAGAQGRVGVSLSKYKTVYTASVDQAGEMTITKTGPDSTEVELAGKSVKPFKITKATLVKFANVDHQLIFEVGDEKLKFDLGSGPDDAGERIADIESQAKIFGSGKLSLRHVAIFRDIHYTSDRFNNSGKVLRAGRNNPLELATDQFFVLGDNSPASHDGRWWSSPGIGNNGMFYRTGIVPRDYLLGKAVLVYWPSAYGPAEHLKFIVPNVGDMRLIHGGSNDPL